ncbi:MAG TPA: hypothetical protein VMU99_08180 [Acidimicrobiales bacterium]|nr:hypothetical protein [Acidimicrobiales bacterium]
MVRSCLVSLIEIGRALLGFAEMIDTRGEALAFICPTRSST